MTELKQSLAKVEAIVYAAKRLCHQTGPDTPFRAGRFTRSLVDAIQLLRHAVGDAGEGFVTEWQFRTAPLKVAHITTHVIVATSREGLVYRNRTRYKTAEAAEKAMLTWTSLQEELGGSLSLPESEWSYRGTCSADHFRKFDDDPYAFFESLAEREETSQQ